MDREYRQLTLKERRDIEEGLNRGDSFRAIARLIGRIRCDVARGLSPQQIALGRAGQIGASPSTIYRWISRGYAGMCDLDLRRKCGYKPRSRAEPPRATAHGGARSFSAFMGLPEEERAAACEMDTVIGLRSDRRCLLTLYLRAFRFQLALLMPDKTAASTESALDMLERAAPRAFARLFPLLLTDNGAGVRLTMKINRGLALAGVGRWREGCTPRQLAHGVCQREFDGEPLRGCCKRGGELGVPKSPSCMAQAGALALANWRGLASCPQHYLAGFWESLTMSS